jgi:hypothetical protein
LTCSVFSTFVSTLESLDYPCISVNYFLFYSYKLDGGWFYVGNFLSSIY